MRILDPHRSGFEDHYAAVGRFMVAFQQVEFALSHHLSIICAHPSRVAPNNLIQAMLADSSFGSLLKFASTLPLLLNPTRLYPPERIAAEWTISHARASVDLQSALKRASLVEQRRNQLVHSSWLTDSSLHSQEGKIYRTKMRNRRGNVEIVYEEIVAAKILRETRLCQQVEGALHISLRAFAELSRALTAYETASAA